MIQNILIFVGLLAVLALGYFLYTQGDIGLNTANTDPAVLINERNTQEFLLQLNQLRAIDLSTDLFVRERFLRLSDYSRPVPALPIGRTNPFVSAP